MNTTARSLGALKNGFIFCTRSGKIAAVIFLLYACAPEMPHQTGKYGAEDLARQWRERSQPIYPTDNDSDYYYPTYRRNPPPSPRVYYPPTAPSYPPYQSAYPPAYDPYRYAPADNDAEYSSPGGRYPTYDPYADSPSAEQTEDNDEEYNYPLFFDE